MELRSQREYATNHRVVGCALRQWSAGVTVTQLTPDGLARKEASGAKSIQYYLPRPYLIITELPSPPPTQTVSLQLGQNPAGSAPNTPEEAPAAEHHAKRPFAPGAGGAPSGGDGGQQDLNQQGQNPRSRGGSASPTPPWIQVFPLRHSTT